MIKTIQFDFSGTVIQTIRLYKDVDIVKMLENGEAFTTIGGSKQILSLPNLESIGLVIDTSTIDGEYTDYEEYQD